MNIIIITYFIASTFLLLCDMKLINVNSPIDSVLQLRNSVNVGILPTDLTNRAGEVVGKLISHVCCRSAVSKWA